MQSRKLSLVEAVTNVVVGFAISLVSQIYIFEQYGVNLPLSQNIAITCWFTVISIVRSYTLRRGFNRIREREPRQAEQYTQFQPARMVFTGHRPERATSTQLPPKPPAPPSPPPPRLATACGRALSDEEVRRLRAAAASMRGPSL